MPAGRMGRRLSAVAGKRRTRWGTKRSRSGRERETTASQLRFLRLMVCGSAFVLLVAVKLLLPGKMAEVSQTLSEAIERSMDVRAVFSAVGGLFDREGGSAGEMMDEVYQAVFHPETAAERTAALPEGGSAALTELRRQSGTLSLPEGTEAAGEEPAAELVLYAEEDLPESVSMKQEILGFDHQTPLAGTLSSGFGYRLHPSEGEERFHYGVDLAADSGTAIGCFADGTVTAVGESSSYGKYCTVVHENGCTTLYAHCSRISVASGTTVKAGEKLGEVGQTGMATGPHLHFEIQKNGVYLDPVYYVETA